MTMNPKSPGIDSCDSYIITICLAHTRVIKFCQVNFIL